MVKQFLHKTFGLRDGEIHISFLMQLYIFLIITVLLIIKPTVNALFLSELGAQQLPYGYIMVAIVAVITTYYYNRWIKQFSFLKVTITSIAFFSLSFMVLGLILTYYNLSRWSLYLYYIGVALFAVITTSQFWILANLVFNSREAKRLYGFIGAGAIAGGIFGGYLTSIISINFGNNTAIFIATILLLSCIPILQKIWSLRIRKLNAYERALRKDYNEDSHEPAFNIIRKSKHLSYLALLIGFGVIVAKLVDFQFSDFANKAIPNSNDLASFFGFWFSTFNVIALSIQLFITNKVLSKLGVSSTLLILPLGLALGSLLFLTFPELWVLIIIKGIDGCFKQSLNKAAVELSIMPIPFNIKNQAKSFIDVAVDSIATGLSGLLLLLFIKRLDLPTTYITVIILLFAFIWIVLIYKLREAYFNSFRQNIQRNLLTETMDEKSPKRINTIAIARRILSSDDETKILAILDRLSTYNIKTLKTEIIQLLDFPSNSVKSEVIKQLYRYDKGTAIEKIKTFIFSNDDQLVHESLRYLLEYSNLTDVEFFDEYLDHENPYISSAALLCLAEETSDNSRLRDRFNLESRIAQQIAILFNEDNETRTADITKLLLSIAHSKIGKFYSYLHVNLRNKNTNITKYAIKAAGITTDERFVKDLINFLRHKFYRKTAINALKNYSGNISSIILDLENQDDITDEAKRYVPTLVTSFNNQKSVKILFRLLKSKDIITRYHASKALNKLKSKNENLYFNKRRLKKLIIRETRYAKNTLDASASFKNIINSTKNTSQNTDQQTEVNLSRESITNVLDEQLAMSIKTIFNFLSLLYDEADIKVSYSGIMSEVKEAQINALEFLDNILQSQIKSEILPLIEYYNVNNDDAPAKQAFQLKLKSENQLINYLLKNCGKRMRLEILHLIRQLKDGSYMSLVHQQTLHRNKTIREFANQTLSVLKATA